MKIKKICFDIDGVVCSVRKDNIYSKNRPIKKNIKLINQVEKNMRLFYLQVDLWEEIMMT